MLSFVKNYFYALNRNISPVIRLTSHYLANIWPSPSNKPVIYCLGDSHNEVFTYIKQNGLARCLRLRCVTVTGATIFGLANPNSKSNALPIFKRELLLAPKNSMLTLMLGEIDCGFLIWLRATKNHTSVEEELNESLNRYRSFLEWTSSLPLRKAAIFSVPPQTITDDQQHGDVAKQRSSVPVDYAARVSLTKRYNRELKKIAEDFNCEFISMDNHLTTAETGLVKPELLNPDPGDHHLDRKMVAPLYARELISFTSSGQYRGHKERA